MGGWILCRKTVCGPSFGTLKSTGQVKRWGRTCSSSVSYVRVGNAAEAYELLQKNRNNKIVGGGIWMRLGSRRVATAIDLSACGLDQIEETETEFRIGAMCTLRQLERHAELNALVNNVFEFAVHDIVGVQLRNTATVGGSIYGRFGFSDVLSAFLALDSYVELTGAGRVPLAEFVRHGLRTRRDRARRGRQARLPCEL